MITVAQSVLALSLGSALLFGGANAEASMQNAMSAQNGLNISYHEMQNQEPPATVEKTVSITVKHDICRLNNEATFKLTNYDKKLGHYTKYEITGHVRKSSLQIPVTKTNYCYGSDFKVWYNGYFKNGKKWSDKSRELLDVAQRNVPPEGHYSVKGNWDNNDKEFYMSTCIDPSSGSEVCDYRRVSPPQ